MKWQQVLGTGLLSGLLALTSHASGLPPLQLVGEARLKVLLWPIYQSRLYTPSGDYEPDTRPLRLEITYLREIKAENLVKQTREEWQHLGLSHPRQGEWLARLRALWPDVNDSDTLSVEVDDSGNTRFYFNGDPIGMITDPAFGEHFLAIWLSPRTSRPELRRDLLGLAGAD